MANIILAAALCGSILYLFDKIAALIKRGKETKEKRSEGQLDGSPSPEGRKNR
jgi:hypothetical protein